MTAVMIFLAGCSNGSDEVYNNAIQNGLDVLATGEYLKAETYFELALEEKPDSAKAESLLTQTTSFNEALGFFDSESYQEAIEKSEEVMTFEDGSNALITKASELIEEINKQLRLIAEEESASEIEQVTATEEDAEKTNEEDLSVNVDERRYEDLIGIYALFESVPYESPMELVSFYTDTQYISGLRESSYSTAEILNVEINGDTFTIGYEILETVLESASVGDFMVEIIDSNGQDVLHYLESDLTLYPITEKELIEEGWSLPPALQDQEDSSIASGSSSDIIDKYNDFSLPLKVLLATTTVDERATTPELLGYTLSYNFDQDTLLVNIHSGAGTGHPWYTMKYNNDTITPVGGVVYLGIDGYEETYVEPTPVSKVDLYNLYMSSQESFDLALERVYEDSDMTLYEYELMRSGEYN